MKNQAKAYGFTALSIVFWATVATAFKIALQQITPVQLLFVSTISSVLILLIIAIVTGKIKKLKSFNSKDFVFSAIMGFINPFGYYLILFEAYRLLPAQIAQPLNCTWGIVIVFLSIPILKQKVHWQNFLALIISFMGVTIIAYGGKTSDYLNISIPGVLLALSTSFIWSIYWLINAGDDKDEVLRLFVNFVFGTLYISIYVLLRNSLNGMNSAGILPAIYVGIFEMGLTFWLWLQAMKYSENTARISIYIYIFPVLSMGFIYLFLGERILFTSFIGLLLVIAGVVLNKVFEK